MAKLVLFHKPYGVLSQFSGADPSVTLAGYIDIPGIYPAGRLDKDSEGLLLLTDDGRLQDRIAAPRHKLVKRYWAQVEGNIEEPALVRLRRGLVLKDGPTKPAEAQAMAEPDHLWPRDPPIRVRKSVPDAWLELSISEGRNRQVRRMTAAVGLPTLRLIRVAVGDWQLAGLRPGEFRTLSV